MSTWVQGTGSSPDRMDALVWGATALQLGTGLGEAWLEAWKKMTEAGSAAAVVGKTPTAACQHFWFGDSCTKCGEAR